MRANIQNKRPPAHGLWVSTCLFIAFGTACSNSPRRDVLERYPTGGEEIVRTYHTVSDTSIYLLEEFYDSGHKRVVGQVHGDTSRLKSWYENGQLKAEWVEISKVEHGPIRCWYPNGQLKKTGTLSLGKPIGNEERWHDNGGREYEASYVNGLKEGHTQYWSGTGRYVSRTYHNDTMTGPSLEIDSLGVHTQGQYVQGLEEGEWVWTDSSGNVMGTKTYHLGKEVE